MGTEVGAQFNVTVDFLSCAQDKIDRVSSALPKLRTKDSGFSDVEQRILKLIDQECGHKLNRDVILLAFSKDDRAAAGFVQGLLLSARSLIWIAFYPRDRRQ